MDKQEQMSKEKDIFRKLEKLKENKHFPVPNAYFDSFADRVMGKIAESEKPVKKPSFFLSVRPHLAVAASLTALFLLAYTAISILLPNKASKGLTENEIIAALEQDIYYLDENYLFNLLDIEPIDNSMENIELSDEEIIEYLIEEDSDIDLFNPDF